MSARGKKGFTLVETLVALLILTMLTGVIATGTSVGVRAYRDSLFVSESDLLSSTIDAALGDILRYAKAYSDDTGSGSAFENADYGIKGGGFVVPDSGSHAGHIMIAPRGTSSEEDYLILVSDGAYSNLKIQALTLDYDDHIFSGEYTIVNLDGSRRKTVEFAFRTLMMD